MNNFFPLANAYKTYGQYEPPGPGVRPLNAPLANHIVSSTTEADEIDYPAEPAYNMSVPMYESQIASYPPPPSPSPAALPPVGVNSPPRSSRERFNSPRASAEGAAIANHVLDYNKLQGTNNPTDLSSQILRDTNYRYITVQNSSYRPIGLGITTYYTGTLPSIRFIVEPGITRYLGINSQGEPAQYAWPLDPETGHQVGNPSILSAISNDFVLRDGINGWKIQKFTRPSYRAAF